MTLPSSSLAYFLVFHGSRDARPQMAMNRLAQLVREEIEQRGQSVSAPVSFSIAEDHGDRRKGPSSPLGQGCHVESYRLTPSRKLKCYPSDSPGYVTKNNQSWVQPVPMVGTGCLETSPIPLNEQLYEFGMRARAVGVRTIKVIPLFLLAGVHVMEDIPAEVEQAQSALGKQITLETTSHLGSHPGIQPLLQNRFAETTPEGWILLAHGSRRPGGNQSVEALAAKLEAVAAFWSVPPDLETQVIHLMQLGCQRLTILPYFLFSGSTTDAITRLTEDLAERFSQVAFRLLPPLGATPELAALLLELPTKATTQIDWGPPRPMRRVALQHSQVDLKRA